MTYSENDILNELEQDGRKIQDYLVILGNKGVYDSLYFVHENILFVILIEDNDLFFQSIQYVKKKGQFYESKDELRKLRPELILL